MKALSTAVFALLAMFVSCGIAREEKAAIEEFNKDLAVLKAWKKETEQRFGKNPMGKNAALKEMLARFKAVNTDGLPADLKEAWLGSVDSFEARVKAILELPEDPAELQRWASDPKLQLKLAEMRKRLAEMAAQGNEKVSALKLVARKYGIDAWND